MALGGRWKATLMRQRYRNGFLSLLMLVGRLEIYTILVLIRPLRKNRRQYEQQHGMDKLEENAMFEPLVREE